MAKMIMPVIVKRLNGFADEQDYGPRLIDGRWEFHRGLDFGNTSGVSRGDTIYAAAGGTVHKIGKGGAGGHSIQIKSVIDGQLVFCYYAHMISAPDFHVGQLITAGTPIGRVGATGNRVRGAHLHFEIQIGKMDFSDWRKSGGYPDAGASVNPLDGWIDKDVTVKTHPSGLGNDGGSVSGSAVSSTPKYTVVDIERLARNGLSGHGALYDKIAKQFDVNPLFLMALSRKETSGNSSNFVNGNNPGNVKRPGGNNGFYSFDTLEEGVIVMARTLRNTIDRKAKEGKVTLVAVGSSYAPVSDGNSTWVSGIMEILEHDGFPTTDEWMLGSYEYAMGGGGSGSSTSGVMGSAGSGLTGVPDLFDLSNEVGNALHFQSSPTRIAGISPDPTKDNYPKHRYSQNPFVLRIGDSQFFIPPINIQFNKEGATGAVPTMRNRTSMLKKSGWTEGYLTINLMFADINQINGYKVEAPDDTHYYMDGVRSLLAQFHKNPMLPIRNEYINNALGIFNVLIEDIQIMTVENFPNMLSVTIIARECVTSVYTNSPEFMYDICFNYPIWRWFYQNLLVDEENKRLESVYLRPIDTHMRDDFFVRVIDKDEVEEMKEYMSNPDNSTAYDFEDKTKVLKKDNDEITKINSQYLLSRFKGVDIRMLMSDWDLGDIHVTSVRGSITKQLARINMLDYEAPVFQDLGGIDKIFEVNIKMTNRDQVDRFNTLIRVVEETAREYRHMFVGGFIEVHNDIINMCGVDFCMVENAYCSTTPINGVFEGTLLLREFNPNQSNHESLQGIKTDIHDVTKEWIEKNGLEAERKFTAHKSDRFNTVQEEFMIETLIKQLELYPDLRLPSIVDMDIILKKINEWREKRGYEKVPFDTYARKEGDVWVEPDFYFMYPSPQDAFDSIGLSELGLKMDALINEGSYSGYINPSRDLDDGNSQFQKWRNLAFDRNGSELLEEVSGRRVGNQFDAPEATEIGTTQEFVYPSKPIYTPFFHEWHGDIKMPEPEVLASLMLHDQVKYDQRGRMSRFFPTYMMMFVDEGQWIDGRRLWNTHYAYHAVHEMTITKDKNNPVDTAYIRLSNMYGTFNSESNLKEPSEYFKYNRNANGTWDFLTKTLVQAWNYTAKDLMVNAQKMMQHAALEAGARIHLRMGNSSNTDNLPTVFNGQIVSVNDGVDIEIFAQGDGAELVNGPISGNPGDSSPSEPHNAIQKYLTQRQSNYWFTVASDLEFFYNYESLYGVEHFGWVQSMDSQDTSLLDYWSDLMNGPERYETNTGNVFKNILNFIGNIFGVAPVKHAITTTWAHFTTLADAHKNFIVGLVTGNPSFVTYDVMKNVFRGRTDVASTGIEHGKSIDGEYKESTPKDPDSLFGMFETTMTSFLPGAAGAMFDGEMNVTLAEANKTIWDIGTGLSLFVPEFIFAVHPHGMRSTVFFGLPHWLVKYKYHKPAGAGEDLRKWQEEVKPFQQVHVINSGIDLIYNGIKASSELLRHDQTALYSRGSSTNTKEGVTVYADKSILSDQRKRDVIDTGVLQDVFGPDGIINALMFVATGVYSVINSTVQMVMTELEKLEGVGGFLTNKLGVDFDGIKEGLDSVEEGLRKISNLGESQAIQVAIGNVQRNFMEMYQGQIVVFGSGAMKPWDLIYMEDSDKMMTGNVQIGQITHSISRQTGFLSTFKPDLIVTRVEEIQGRNRALKSAMQFAAFAGMMVLRVFSKTKFGGWLMSGTWKRTKALGLKVAQGADNISHRFGGIKAFDAIHEWIDSTSKVETQNGSSGSKVDVDISEEKMDSFFRKVIKSVGRSIITLAIAGIAEEFFARWWNKKTKYNNVIYIHPLMKGGVPYTAGIKGALHIIPNYQDPRYKGTQGMNMEELTGNGLMEGYNIPASGEIDWVLSNPYGSFPEEHYKVGKPGMTPTHIVIHETFNYSVGADAKMHAKYINSGQAYKQKTPTSWHFTVDDSIVIQHYELDWKAYHAGSEEGNNGGIGIELCVNEGNDFEKTKDKAAMLCADLIVGLGLSVDKVTQHNQWSGKDCPKTLRDTNKWPDFIALVAKYVEEIKVEKQKKQAEDAVDSSATNSSSNVSSGPTANVSKSTNPSDSLVDKSPSKGSTVNSWTDYPKYSGAKTTKEVVYKAGDYIGMNTLVHPSGDISLASISRTFNPKSVYGIDFSIAKQARLKSIRAIDDGVVVYMGNHPWSPTAYGWCIIIEHDNDGNKYYSMYNNVSHTSSTKKYAKDSVKKGEKIGDVDIKKNRFQLQIHIDKVTLNDGSYGVGSRVNPIDFMKKGGVKL